MVWFFVRKAPCSRTQCHALFGSVSLPGIQGGRKWFNRLLSTLGGLQGQRKVICVNRDFAAPGNSHDPASRYQGYAQPTHWNKVVESCAGHAYGGMRPERKRRLQEAARFTVHSCRHFLPHCFAASLLRSLTRASQALSVEGGQRVRTAQMHDPPKSLSLRYGTFYLSTLQGRADTQAG